MQANAKTPSSPRLLVLGLAKERGILRPKDLEDIGVPREYLRRLRDE